MNKYDKNIPTGKHVNVIFRQKYNIQLSYSVIKYDNGMSYSVPEYDNWM